LWLKRTMKLQKVSSVELIPTSPFDFDSTFHKPDHFTSEDNAWQPGVRWQTWAWGSQCLGLIFRNMGDVDSPHLQIDVYARKKVGAEDLSALVDEVKYRYNLDLDLKDFYQAFGEDEILGPIIRRWRGMRPGHPSSLHEYLIIGIVLQNATIRRSIQMFTALLENYGALLEFDGKRLWCFWQPGALHSVSEAELRGLKIGYRAKSIKKIDDNFFEGTLDELELRGKDRETQMQALLKLYGVGPATVWYLLFDVFHHWDFFNHVSPWEQKIYSKLFFDQDPEHPVEVRQILAHFERFNEYKQLAVHYIWEDLWWKREHEDIPWLEKLIRV
jgi:3-methyladenine DNA glycosylase/8-oxoguanine DNA glycosylase